MNELKKSIHDNANGLDYTLVNDHYLPNLTVAAPAEHPTGRWGRLHKTYLNCLLYTSPSPRDSAVSRMPSSA